MLLFWFIARFALWRVICLALNSLLSFELFDQIYWLWDYLLSPTFLSPFGGDGVQGSPWST